MFVAGVAASQTLQRFPVLAASSGLATTLVHSLNAYIEKEGALFEAFGQPLLFVVRKRGVKVQGGRIV